MTTEGPSRTLAAPRVLTPDGVLQPGWVRIVDDTVVETRRGVPGGPGVEDLPGTTLAPGYVDVHHHGGGGASYGGGEEAARAALAAHRTHGTTSAIASLVSEDEETLVGQVRELGPLVRSGELCGIHLEGPWLSPSHRGAHDPEVLTDPLWAQVERVLSAGDGAIRMVTLAPELPGALDTIRRLRSAGVVVAIGHSDATYDQARAALDAGATVATHLFNAMRPVHHREPGPVPALLEDPDAFVELIADGVHLHPAILRMAATAKPDRTVLVTDAMAAAAAADGLYELGPMSVQVCEGVARLVDNGAIAGSTLTMDRAVRYAVERAGLPVDLALRAATSNPAAMLGLTDVGAIRPGSSADLVALDDALVVRRVMRHGQWLS